ANRVISYSSQNDGEKFSAAQVPGAPDVYPQYDASPNAWVSNSPDGQREYLELGFANASPVNYVDIYETLNPGAVDSVYVKNPGTSAFDLVYSGAAAPVAKTARKNRLSFALTSYNVSEVRIVLNSAAVPGYNAIDAVGIGQSIL